MIAFKFLWASVVSTSFSNILYCVLQYEYARRKGDAVVECTGKRRQGVVVVTYTHSLLLSSSGVSVITCAGALH